MGLLSRHGEVPGCIFSLKGRTLQVAIFPFTLADFLTPVRPVTLLDENGGDVLNL